METNVWHEVYRILCKDVPKFRYPGWFNYLANQLPAGNPRSRRDGARFLSLLQAVARCRSFSDGRREKSNGVIEINFADYCVAYRILNKAFASTYAGAHPMALEFANAVRDLSPEGKKSVTTKDVAAHLGWKESVAHKWRRAALEQRLIEEERGTHPQNKKPVVPGPARIATTFLPDPLLVFREQPEIGDVVRYIDPLTGKGMILRRAPTNGDKEE
jgi:hypothetical protein